MGEVTRSKLPLEIPQRKRGRDKSFYGPCAIDGKFSSRLLVGEFMRPNAKRTTAGKTVTDTKLEKISDAWLPSGTANIKKPLTKRVDLKAEICLHHREANEIKLPGNQGHAVLGPTTALHLEDKCLEPILWKSEPTLKIKLATSDVVAIGSTFADAAKQYFDSRRLQVLGRRGLNGYIAQMLAFPEDTQLTYPMRIASDASYSSVRAQLIEIRETALSCLQITIERGVLRNKVGLFQDSQVRWAEAEHRIAVPLSTLLLDLFGIQNEVPEEFDPLVLGELDVAVSRWLKDEEVLEVVIDDYKTLPEEPSDKTIEYYRHSIQFPIYGALMDWAHLSIWEEMPRIRILTRAHLIWDSGTKTVEVPYSREIALQALRRYYRYKPYLAKAREFGKGRSFKEVADKYFPAVANDEVCPNCFAYGVCSLTRPLDGPTSYLDEIMPTRKERLKGQNMPLWDQS